MFWGSRTVTRMWEMLTRGSEKVGGGGLGDRRPWRMEVPRLPVAVVRENIGLRMNEGTWCVGDGRVYGISSLVHVLVLVLEEIL